MDRVIKSVELIATPISFEKLNSQLTRCRCYVVASGRNANYSDITLDAIKNSIPTLLNMPVVANLYRKEDGSGWAVGAHDMEITFGPDFDDIDVTDLTVPFGVVPENCNPEIVEVLEPDGETKNSYLVVDILLWTGRYNIMDASYSDDFYFSQSCELLVDKGFMDDDGFYVIEGYTFSALCLLGKSSDPKYNKLPCFPSARVEKLTYSLDEEKFRQDFALLMQEVKNCKFNTADETPENQQPESAEAAENEVPADTEDSAVLDKNTEEDPTPESTPEPEPEEGFQENQKKEDESNLKNEKLEILFSDVCEKINVLMNEHKYRATNNKQYNKYIVLDVVESEAAVIAVDRENEYSAHKIPYLANQTDEGLVINFDFENKTDMTIGAVEKTGAIFNVNDEVAMVAKDTSDHDVEVHSNARINELMEKLDETTKSLEASQEDNTSLRKQLGVYEKEKEEYQKQKHKDIIDALVASKRNDMGKYSELLEYCIEIDYTKDVETVESELKEIHYNFMLKNSPSSKQTFSAIETEVVDDVPASDTGTDRWGEENTKYFKQ